MKTVQVRAGRILQSLPPRMKDSEILNFIYTKKIDWKYVNAIKDISDFKDDTISDWLNINVKTFRSYKSSTNQFKDNIKEQILLILTLIKHGMNVFGSSKKFEEWLNTENFYFDKKKPLSFLKTVTGLRFVDDQLTAIEYGDNV